MRPRRSFKHGGIYLEKSAAAKAWLSDAIGQLCAQRGRVRPITGPAYVAVVCYQPHDACDGDNMESLAWDAIKKAKLVEDDKQFVSWAGVKLIDAARPRIEVYIRPLAPGELLFPPEVQR